MPVVVGKMLDCSLQHLLDFKTRYFVLPLFDHNEYACARAQATHVMCESIGASPRTDGCAVRSQRRKPPLLFSRRLCGQQVHCFEDTITREFATNETEVAIFVNLVAAGYGQWAHTCYGPSTLVHPGAPQKGRQPCSL